MRPLSPLLLNLSLLNKTRHANPRSNKAAHVPHTLATGHQSRWGGCVEADKNEEKTKKKEEAKDEKRMNLERRRESLCRPTEQPAEGVYRVRALSRREGMFKSPATGPFDLGNGNGVGRE